MYTYRFRPNFCANQIGLGIFFIFYIHHKTGARVCVVFSFFSHSPLQQESSPLVIDFRLPLSAGARCSCVYYSFYTLSIHID